ncbi:hypothetical protein AB0F91_11005 [Amycolatopsis sp. NPDC023774]|uniref:hypothetical protein n=1 Tax=Amycolatopsis sp. NPDC023774 TaxID=3155015 RepID=UPI0033F765A9
MMDQGAGGPEDPERDPRWDLVRAVARRHVATPSGLVDRVLRALTVARRVPPLRLPCDGGVLTVSEATLVRLARTVATDQAEDVDGVTVSAVALADGELQILATIRFGVVADEAARVLRHRLTAELTRLLRARPPRVNVHVVDVRPG